MIRWMGVIILHVLFYVCLLLRLKNSKPDKHRANYVLGTWLAGTHFHSQVQAVLQLDFGGRWRCAHSGGRAPMAIA